VTGQRDFWQVSEDHGFHAAQLTVCPEMAAAWMKLALIGTEVSEAIDALRDLDQSVDPALQDLFTHSDSGKPEGVASELADVLIRAFDAAETLGFDLMQAVLDKHAYNKTREHMHGRNA